MSTKEEFQQASIDIKSLSSKPSNEDLLALYALFKQGNQGQVTGSRPGMMNLVGRAKYDAWKALGTMPEADAQLKYIAKVKELITADS